MKKINVLLVIFGLTFICTVVSAQEITADLGYFPKVEFNDKIVESHADDHSNTFEKIVIDGFDSKIPFYRIIPKDKKEDKYMLLLHGLTGNKDNWVNPTTSLSKKYVQLKDSLLSLGYIILLVPHKNTDNLTATSQRDQIG